MGGEEGGEPMGGGVGGGLWRFRGGGEGGVLLGREEVPGLLIRGERALRWRMGEGGGVLSRGETNKGQGKGAERREEARDGESRGRGASTERLIGVFAIEEWKGSPSVRGSIDEEGRRGGSGYMSLAEAFIIGEVECEPRLLDVEPRLPDFSFFFFEDVFLGDVTDVTDVIEDEIQEPSEVRGPSYVVEVGADIPGGSNIVDADDPFRFFLLDFGLVSVSFAICEPPRAFCEELITELATCSNMVESSI